MQVWPLESWAWEGMVFGNQSLGVRDFFFSSAVLTPRVPTLPKMGSVGDWEVTAESQVSRCLSFLSCPDFSWALAPARFSSLRGLPPAEGHISQGVSLCPRHPICWASPQSCCSLRGWPHTWSACVRGLASGLLGPASAPRVFSIAVLVLYVPQEALGPGKHAEKEFCKDPPGDGCGNGVPLGKETAPSQEDLVFWFLVHSVPKECLSPP